MGDSCWSAKGLRFPEAPGSSLIETGGQRGHEDGTFCELAHRSSGGLEVTLFWHSGTDEILARVWDRSMGTCFQIRPEHRLALDVYYHPYSYLHSIEAGRDDELPSLEPHASFDPGGVGHMSLNDSPSPATVGRLGRAASPAETTSTFTVIAHPSLLAGEGEAVNVGFDSPTTGIWPDNTTPAVLLGVIVVIAIVAAITWLGLDLFSV